MSLVTWINQVLQPYRYQAVSLVTMDESGITTVQKPSCCVVGNIEESGITTVQKPSCCVVGNMDESGITTVQKPSCVVGNMVESGITTVQKPSCVVGNNGRVMYYNRTYTKLCRW